ncbi:hypothetical protein D3C78_611260 [compost metagenome]
MLLAFQVGAGELVEAVGGAQQVVGKAHVDGIFMAQQGIHAGCWAGFLGQLGDSLFRLLAAFLADHRLQFEELPFLARNAFAEQVALAVGKVQQQIVAGQLLAQQQGPGVQRRLFGQQFIVMLGAQRLAAFLAGLERGGDFQQASLVAADVGLGAFRTGLRGDDLTLGFYQLLLPGGHLAALLVQQHFQLGGAVGGIELPGGLLDFAAEARQHALVLVDQTRRVGQLAFQLGHLLVAVVFCPEQLEGVFQGGLDHFLVGFGQLAISQAVQALLHVLGLGRVGVGSGNGQAGDGRAEKHDGEEGTQQE